MCSSDSTRTASPAVLTSSPCFTRYDCLPKTALSWDSCGGEWERKNPRCIWVASLILWHHLQSMLCHICIAETCCTTERTKTIHNSVLHSYVDNGLQSLPTIQESKQLLVRMRQLLASRGSEIQQWASNRLSGVDHIPHDLKALNSGCHDRTKPRQGTLGLSWHCLSDRLGCKHWPVEYKSLTLIIVWRNPAL